MRYGSLEKWSRGLIYNCYKSRGDRCGISSHFIRCRFDYEKSLSEIKELNEEDRKEILAEYLESNEIGEKHASEFYNCMSDMVYNKSGTLSLGEVLGWCKDEFLRNGNSAKMYM